VFLAKVSNNAESQFGELYGLRQIAVSWAILSAFCVWQKLNFMFISMDSQNRTRFSPSTSVLPAVISPPTVHTHLPQGCTNFSKIYE
jgi:hypothetical protein